ncbi:twin-arginine translocase subunit TatC [Pedobacter fastidiosus]|uniref:Sec-independent protein translocase protein TatC n=1 Tax=Pedobacter fastidiosus TaxID=2765361 RepID=A0ABR7KWL1_9SPHI|nr:twin-arginine translocase subunit TatC [Pedobacter fastidiosus]MBC6112489.1 twin-arginine translocase subunit TatC [Pedobacter fastidiosus]
MLNKNTLRGWLSDLKNRGNNRSGEMSFFGHLDVLRKHLIRSALAIAMTTSWAFIYYDFVFDKIILGPKKADFLTYRMMCWISEHFHLSAAYCLKEINFKIINTEMAGQFNLQLNSSVIIGIILGFPYLLFEIWLFIKPALNLRERKAASGFVFYASLLFLLGIFFGYYIIAPYSIRFLVGFHVSEVIENQITIDSYLSSIVTLTLGTGIIFEMPIIVLILSGLGLLTPKLMRSSRRYAVVIMLIIAAVVTPTPDIQTMLIVFLPLMILYEISIMVALRVERNAMQPQKVRQI